MNSAKQIEAAAAKAISSKNSEIAAAEAKMRTHLKSLSTDLIIRMVSILNAPGHESAEETLVFSFALTELETRMSDAEYIVLMAWLEEAN